MIGAPLPRHPEEEEEEEGILYCIIAVHYYVRRRGDYCLWLLHDDNSERSDSAVWREYFGIPRTEYTEYRVEGVVQKTIPPSPFPCIVMEANPAGTRARSIGI